MSSVKQELKIRKRVQASFNKEREDFESKQDWDDYLEETEDIIFNLVEGVDVDATEAKLARYQKENQTSIAEVTARKAEKLRQKSGIPVKPAALPRPQEQQDSAYAAQPHLLPPKPQAVPVLLESAADNQPTNAAAWAQMAAASGWRTSYITDRLRQAAFGAHNLLPAT